MRLSEQRDVLIHRLAVLRLQLGNLEAYLCGPKFCGTDPRDGTPKDYVNTGELLRLISQTLIPMIDGDSPGIDDEALSWEALQVLGTLDENYVEKINTARSIVQP